MFRDALGPTCPPSGRRRPLDRDLRRHPRGREAAGDGFVESIALADSGWAWLARGEARPDLFARHLELSLRSATRMACHTRSRDGGLCGGLGDLERAGVLLGASETARLRTGLATSAHPSRIGRSSSRPRVGWCRGVRGGPRRGRRMPRRAAIDLVLDQAGLGVPMTGSAADGRPIRTPDQRLRVFVSSTLQELEPERRAARAAIERLHLAPVMFELGARPHPPRELYRAYLEQSDVFVGVYWQQYGWVAPGEEISGLEDEYRLAPRDMPKLIYVKHARRTRGAARRAHGPDPRRRHRVVHAVLDRRGARRADRGRPRDPARRALRRVPRRSAATGSDSSAGAAADVPAPAGRIPAPYHGRRRPREFEVATLLTWLGEDAQRLVTLVGPGGIGKSRLAIEVAHSRRTAVRPGDVRVASQHVRDPDDVLPAIARDLGVRDAGDRPLAEQIGVGARRPPRPHRARQLRAGARCGARTSCRC